MKRVSLIFSIIITLTLFLSACVPINPSQANQQVSEAYIQTAVASTLVAERAKLAGASLSFTSTPDGTLAPEETPETGDVEAETEDDEIDDPEPTLEYPWMLQNWCLEHMSGCVEYNLQNRTDSWLQVEIKELETGVTRFFTIRSQTTGEITLIPRQYSVRYTWWCSGNAKSLSIVKSLGSWIDVFKCPQGFHQKISK